MKAKRSVSVVTERGQVSIPAELRRALSLRAGKRLLWEQVSDSELRVRRLDDGKAPGPLAVLGFARKPGAPIRTREWMNALRAGEK